MRIGILGANGQVGAEVCMVLSQQKGVEVVPICRNRFGSAFLRYSGLACRHGNPADAKEAALLYGDCDLIADFSLASLVPDYQLAKEIHNRLIENVAQYTNPSAKYVYFSTLMVYGDAHVGQLITFRDIYGHEKFRCEKFIQQNCKNAFIFRLGHVCGELQGFTRSIREAIACGPVLIPDLQRASNTVYVATIVDAIMKVATDQALPGTYDLVNKPQWSWKEVLEYEGKKIGINPKFENCIESSGLALFLHSVRRFLAQLFRGIIESTALRKLSTRLLPLLPIDWNLKIKAIYSQKSAATQIAHLNRVQQQSLGGTNFRPLGENVLNTLTPTLKLLADLEFETSGKTKLLRWPDDIPLNKIPR